MPKFNAPQLIPGLYAADVISKSTGQVKTYFVRLTFDGAAPPAAFIDALRAAGFNSNQQANPEPITDDVLCVIEFGRPGTGMFNAWTPEEAAGNFSRLRAVFEAHDVPFAPRQATFKDLV